MAVQFSCRSALRLTTALCSGHAGVGGCSPCQPVGLIPLVPPCRARAPLLLLPSAQMMSESDPMCVLSISSLQTRHQWHEVGRTEQIKNAKDPDFVKAFEVSPSLTLTRAPLPLHRLSSGPGGYVVGGVLLRGNSTFEVPNLRLR